MRCEKGHQMSTVIGVGLWQASCECGVFTISLSGKNCSLRLTPLAPDSLKAEVLSLPESVLVENALPAVGG